MATPTATLATLATMAARLEVTVNIPSITPPVINIPSITPFTYTPIVRTDCVTATPDPSGFVPAGSCNALWQYFPSMAAAIVFSVIFGALLIAHLTQSIVYKKKFCWVIITAVSWEFGAFVTRSLAVHHQQSNGLALVSQSLELLSPLWINAFVYMVLARFIYFLVPSHKILGVRASIIAFVFVWLDVVSFIIQLVGSFIAAPGAPADQSKNGIHIYMGGVGIQQWWILVVIILGGFLWTETRRLESRGALRGDFQRGWRKYLIVVFIVLGLITMRIIFRLVEFSAGTGPSNPLPTTEWYFYVFDAGPMSIASALLSVFHPGTFLQGPFSEFPQLKKSDRKEVKRLKKVAQEQAKTQGVHWFERVHLGMKVKHTETERIAAEGWGVVTDTKVSPWADYEL